MSALVLGMATLAACGRETSKEPSVGTSAPVPVITAAVAVGPLADRLEAGGVVEASTNAVIASRIVAPIVTVRVRPGDRVRSGDVLIVLDDRASAAHAREAESGMTAAGQALAAARTELTAATAEEKVATVTHDRIAALYERRSATMQELDDATARLASATARSEAAQARIAQATAQVAAARAAAEAASTTQTFATLTAPFDGVVTDRLTDPGNLATPGAPLVRLDAAGARRVKAPIDAARAPYLHVGSRVDVLLDDRPEPLEGRVVEMARALAADQAFVVKVALPEGVGPPSGTFARIRFQGADRQALMVPGAAIRRDGQLVSAFVVDNGVARLRLLRVGQSAPEAVEALAGIEAGERVIVSPPPQLVDGMKVSAGAQPAAERGSR